MNRDPLAVACPDCFSNFGLAQSVRERCAEQGGPCPNCGVANAHKIDTENLGEAAVAFFVRGSVIAETFAPVYQANELNDDPARFDPTLAADVALIKQLTGLTIFHYGPPLWRLGMTNHYYEFDAGGTAAHNAAASLVKNAQVLTLPAGTRLFRIRRNAKASEAITTAAAFDPPPPQIEREPGRWDSDGLPVLYVSDDLELCLHECRVVIADEILAATLVPTRDLRLLDLTQDLPMEGGTPFDDPNIFIRIACISRGRWLDYCREIARAAHAAGYDGIRYASYYLQAKHDLAAVNLALFGAPIADGMLTLNSVNRVRLTDMKYKVSFGPVLYQDEEMRAELAGMKAKWEEIVDAGLETPADYIS
jgi:hypothetical protein